MVKPINIFAILVFLLIGVEIVKDLTSSDKTVDKKVKELKEVRITLQSINEIQGNYRLKSDKFFKTFDELKMNLPNDGNTITGKGFQFKISVISTEFVVVGSKSINKNVQGFSGAVVAYKNTKGFLGIKKIVCESEVVGLDGTDPANAPILDKAGNMKCPTGWNVLSEQSTEDGERIPNPLDK